ncbi:MAG: hypothetical protein AB9922_01500 [Bacteroidales bacterium]
MFRLTGSIISYERGRRLLQFLFCLFLAFVIWSVHKLSDNYSYFFQFGVLAKSSLGGKEPEALSENKLSIRARTSGFYILQYKFGKADPFITISPENRVFRKVRGEAGSYYVLTSEVRDLIGTATGDKILIENLNTDTLFFKFKGVSQKNVPVGVKSSITYKEQYMRSGEIRLNPPYITLYGESALIDKVDTVYTQVIKFEKAGNNINGVVKLESIAGTSISQDEVLYSLNVERYVEKELTLPVKVDNLPEGVVVNLNPAEVKFVYRVPFGLSKDENRIFTDLRIDFRDIERSTDTLITPVVDKLNPGVLEFRLVPGFVECKIIKPELQKK